MGTDAYSFLARERAIVGQLTELLKGRPEELPERVHGLVTRLKDAERDLDKLKQEQARAAAGSLTDRAIDVGGVTLLRHDLGDGAGADDLRSLATDLRSRLGEDRP